MSYILFGFVLMVALYGFVQLLFVVRSSILGKGIHSGGDLLFRILIISVCAAFALWLGPSVLVGVGLL